MKHILCMGCFLLFFSALGAEDAQAHEAKGPVSKKTPVRPQSGALPKTLPPRKDIADHATFTSSFPEDSLPPTGSIVSIVGLLLLGVGFAAYLKIRKRGGFPSKQSSNLFEVLQTFSTQGIQLSLVRLDKRVYFIGSTDKSLVCLDRWDQGAEGTEFLMPTSRKSQANFQDEYTEMIHRMSEGFPKDQKTREEDMGRRVVSDLDDLKRHLKELV